MALIGTIRKNGWILIALMVLALGGFIMMDVVSNAQRYRSGDVNMLGKVNDTEIKRSEFDTYEKLIYANQQPGTAFQVRQQIWDYFVQKSLLDKEAEALGLGVGREELVELQFGNNLSPIIIQRFAGADGQPNRATLSSIKAAIEGGTFTDPVNRSYWAVQEKEIITERLQEKISSMVLKGIYAPAWQAEMVYKETNQRTNFLYVRIPFDQIPDSEISLTDADYTAYLKENPRLYDQQEETRIIDYVEFDVFPTASDSATAYNAITRMLEGLQAAENDSAYIVSNNGVVDANYRKKDALPLNAADDLVSMPVGSIVGPFQDQNEWVVAKIMGRKIVPDSVKARHILIRDATPDNEKKIDSLLNILNTKAVTFDVLASENSQDPGSAIQGGDLGWFGEGAMVPEFNAVCFYDSEVGKYYKVATQFGWHLIEVTGKKNLTNEAGVRVAFLRQPIEPSTETQQIAKDKVLHVLQQAKKRDDLIELAKKEGLVLQTSQPLKASDYSLSAFNTTSEAREIVRWAFDDKTKVDAVSQEIFAFRDPNGGYFDSKYIVATLKSIAPKGAATVATLKANSRAETEIKNRKKAEAIKGKLKSPNDLNALSNQWSVPVDTAQNATMLQTFLATAGSEPRVVGAAFGLKQGAVSAPITGTSGVYVVKALTDVPEPTMPPDLTMFRRQATSATASGIRMNFMNAWKKQAEVQDNRSRFF